MLKYMEKLLKLKNCARKVETFNYMQKYRWDRYKMPQMDLAFIYKDFPDPEKFKSKIRTMVLVDNIESFSVSLKDLRKIAPILLDEYDPNTDYDYEFLTECPCGWLFEKAKVYLTELCEKITAMENTEWEYLKKYWEK